MAKIFSCANLGIQLAKAVQSQSVRGSPHERDDFRRPGQHHSTGHEDTISADVATTIALPRVLDDSAGELLVTRAGPNRLSRVM